MVRPFALAALAACSSSVPEPPAPTPIEPVSLRIATFNVSMFRSALGQLATELADPAHPQGVAVATLLQEVRPDVILLNELDHDAEGLAVRRLMEGFLAVSQDGREPLVYEHFVAPPVNTGEPSGLDLDHDGTVGGPLGTREYGGDAWGYGEYPGQYGLAVLSRFGVVGQRTFQTFRWAEMDDPQLPDWFTAEEQALVRLSSKTHLDLELDVGGHRLHVLASHPTPPGFDGPEDRNGARNRAEVQFWADYLDGASDSYHVDDGGLSGGIGPGAFAVLGDLNIDPVDGDRKDGIAALLGHPRVYAGFVPTSAGAVEAAAAQGGANAGHGGDPAADTADFSDGEIGNVRADYVIPSTELTVGGGGVLWPVAGEPLFDLVARQPFRVSDHRMVWLDVTIGE